MSERDELKVARCEAREYKKAIKELTEAVSWYEAALDITMENPESNQRGAAIARLTNALVYANDRARYFALGVDYKNDDRRKEALKRKVRKEME